MHNNELRVARSPVVMDEATRSKKIAEMSAWLGHLVGRFQVDGRHLYASGKHAFQGVADCARFGDGPGVRCIIQRTSPSPVMRSSVLQVEGIREDTTLPLIYFGINAESLEIQAIVVDREQPGAQSGTLAGDTVHFADNWKACLRTWAYCWMVAEITAKTAGEIFMKIAVDHWFQGSKGPPIVLMKSGHTSELEMHFSREIPMDAEMQPNPP